MKDFMSMKEIFSSVREDRDRNTWHVHVMKQRTRDSSNGIVYREFFGTTLGNMVLSFKQWLQLHSLQLKMESDCLKLNTMILFILKCCSDKTNFITLT